MALSAQSGHWRKCVVAAMTLLSVTACADGQAQMSQPQQPPQQAVQVSSTQSANYTMEGCRDFIARRQVNAYVQGMCAGKVEAVASLTACFPSDATVGQMIRIVARYIDERPERPHENFIVLARDALQHAWPCRR